MTVFLAAFMILSFVSVCGIVALIITISSEGSFEDEQTLNGWYVAMFMSALLCIVCVASLAELSKYEKQLKEVQNNEQTD